MCSGGCGIWKDELKTDNKQEGIEGGVSHGMAL